MKFYLDGVAYDAQKIKVGKQFDSTIDDETGKWCLICDFSKSDSIVDNTGIQIGEWDSKEKAQNVLSRICKANGVPHFKSEKNA